MKLTPYVFAFGCLACSTSNSTDDGAAPRDAAMDPTSDAASAREPDVAHPDDRPAPDARAQVEDAAAAAGDALSVPDALTT